MRNVLLAGVACLVVAAMGCSPPAASAPQRARGSAQTQRSAESSPTLAADEPEQDRLPPRPQPSAAQLSAALDGSQPLDGFVQGGVVFVSVVDNLAQMYCRKDALAVAPGWQALLTRVRSRPLCHVTSGYFACGATIPSGIRDTVLMFMFALAPFELAMVVVDDGSSDRARRDALLHRARELTRTRDCD